jgi:hypothetical protein
MDMQLRSNIGEVIGRLRQAQAAIPQAVEAGLNPEYWRDRLQLVTEKTLRAQWANERNLQLRLLYERLTPAMVKSLAGAAYGEAGAEAAWGVRFTLSLAGMTGVAGQGGRPDIQAAIEYNLGTRTPTGREKKGSLRTEQQEKNLQATREMIRNWVAVEKERDERDREADGTPYSDERIAQRIERILGLNEDVVPAQRSARLQAMQDAGDRLMAAIQKWMAGDEAAGIPGVTHSGLAKEDQTALRIPPAVARQWLAAVMAAWRSYVKAHLRDRLESVLGRGLAE